jgi:hypothetical protein
VSSTPDTRYVPFLKGKAGEIKALGQLEVEEREALTPLIEVPPRKITFTESGEIIETVDKTLKGYAARLAEAWGKIDSCFIEIDQFAPGVRLEDGRHPLTAFFTDAKAVDLAGIPVTGLDRDDAHLEAVKAVCRKRRGGVAIRLRHPEMQTPAALAERLPGFLESIEQGAEQVDLLLDFGELLVSQVTEVEAAARATILALPDLGTWRSVVLCSGAFPAQISQFIKPGKSGKRPRRDWSLWRRLIESPEPLPRLPAFADYGVTGAEWGPPFNPRTMNPACKIVYADDKEWAIVRGHSFRDHGGGQYRQLAAQMKARDEFLGKDHCSTEEKILDCAAGRGGTGNLEQWVTAATRHHIEVVSNQLASLAESAAAP